MESNIYNLQTTTNCPSAILDIFKSQNIQSQQLEELQGIITQCANDSTKILQIEEHIKKHVKVTKDKQTKIFIMLTYIFVDSPTPQSRQVAILLLKNCIKSYFYEIQEEFGEELNSIENICFLMLVGDATGQIDMDRRLWSQLTLTICEIIKFRFNEHVSDFSKQKLFNSMISFHTNRYTYPVLQSIIQTFETVDDDRMSIFVPYLMKSTVGYLHELLKSENGETNRVLYLIQLLYKTIEFAINTDPKVIGDSLSSEVQKALISMLAQQCFTHVSETKHFIFLEQRRLTSKILTMLVRDFYVCSVDEEIDLFRLCIQNLIYFQPIFQENNLGLWDCQQANLKYESDEIDEEDVQEEIKAYVAQLINLLQTIIGKSKKVQALFLQFVTLTQQQQIQQMDTKYEQIKSLSLQILNLMLGYCFMPDADIGVSEQADLEVQNSFLVNFMETEEDQFNQVSVRLSIIESIEQLGIHDSSFFSKFFNIQNQSGLLQEAIEKLYVQQQCGTASMFTQITSVVQLDIFKHIDQSNTRPTFQNKEIALFMLGQFREYLPITTQFISKILDDFAHEHPLVQMRILWLLEKLCYLEEFFMEDKNEKLQMIFGRLLEMKVQGFALKYQYVKTIVRYMKKINLRETYPESYFQIVIGLLNISAEIVELCNEDTVHIPVECITYLTKIESQITQEFSSQRPGFMLLLKQLFEKYQHDGLLEDDIVDLIKVQASVPGNNEFQNVFVKQVGETIKLFYDCVMNISVNPKMQEEAQRIIDSNLLKNMLSIFNVFLLKNPDFQLNSQYYQEIFKMICEILNSYRETYVNLHCTLTLASFCKTNIGQNKEFQQVLRTLLVKLTSPNLGMDDASSMYLGHAICNMLQSYGIDETNDMQYLLPQCMSRVIKAKLPPICKSMTLPLCYVFSTRQKDLLPQLLITWTQKNSKESLIQFLEAFVGNFSHNVSNTSYKELSTNHVCTIQALAMSGLLLYTTTDNMFAEIKLKQGQLQNVIVYELTEYLEKAAKEEVKNENKDKDQIDSTQNKKDDQYGDYGSDDDPYGGGDYGNYGMEDDFGDFDELDDDPNMGEKIQEEEQFLLNQVIPQSIEPKSLIILNLRLVGPQSISKIVGAAAESKPFSQKQKQILEEMFE